jgi:hypothetical protein
VLSAGKSCRECVRGLLAWLAYEVEKTASVGTAAYCRARARLPRNWLEKTCYHLGEQVEDMIPNQWLWLGHSVRLLDGTSIRLPDSPANQKEFPQPKGQKPGCGFPTIRITALFSLASGALLRMRANSLATGEVKQFQQMQATLQKDQVLVADRNFCSWASFCELSLASVIPVMRKRANLTRSLRTIRRFSKRDRLVRWRKPIKPTTGYTKEQWAELPDNLTARLIHVVVRAKGLRTESYEILTTLLDPREYPPQQFAELYRRRWRIELYFNDIKTQLNMHKLRCKSPHMVEREVFLHLIAYNLIRYLLIEAASSHGHEPETLSFKGTLATLRTWAPLLAKASSSRYCTLYAMMLHYIATDHVPPRPGRREPRAIKDRGKGYPLLNAPRHEYQEIPHPNRYKATP